MDWLGKRIDIGAKQGKSDRNIASVPPWVYNLAPREVALTDEDMPEVPGYRFESKMAEGGMGVVYRAVDETLGRTVAVKMIRHSLLGPGDERTETVSRFLREARAAAQIQSNHVAHVLQFGQTDSGDLFLVLEYLSGQTLADVLRSEKRVNVQRAVRIMRQVCRGMEAAHRMGIVHRDLKPSNIMLIEQDGELDFAKILDFGVAKVMGDQESGVTRSGMLVGTYTCMAPEQVNNDTIDARTDIYALAVMLFRMIAGRPLFAGNDFAVVLYHHVHTQAPLLSEAAGYVHIPDALNELVRRCLSKNPNERVQTMAEFDRLLGESVIGQTEMISAHSSLVTQVQDTQGQGMSTLLDDLHPPEDEDEIFSYGSASAPHPGRHVAEPTRGADANQATQTQARHEQTVSSDEAETRSASFQLRGYDVMTNTGGASNAAHERVSAGPPMPPPHTSAGEISSATLQDRLRPMQNLLANGELSGANLRVRPARKIWIASASACAILVVALVSLMLSRTETTPVSIADGVATAPTHQVLFAPAEAKATRDDNAASDAAVTQLPKVTAEQGTKDSEMPTVAEQAEAPAAAASPVAKAAETAKSASENKPAARIVSETVTQPAAAASPAKTPSKDAPEPKSAKARTKKKRSKKQTKEKATRSTVAQSAKSVSETKDAKPVSTPAAQKKPSRPSFIRVRTGNE